MGQSPERKRRIPPVRLLEICLFVILFGLMPVVYLNLSISVLDDLANKDWGGADFTAYYTAASLIRSGKSPYNATARVQQAQSLGFREDRPYLYPPLLAIVITPFTSLPPQHAILVWFCISVALLILSTTLIIRTLKLHKSGIYVVALLIATLAFYPAILSVFVGQANILILFLIVLAYCLSKCGRERLAGMTLALASLIKIFPFCIVLYYLWKGKYTVFLYALAALILLTSMGIAVAGLHNHEIYLTEVLPSLAQPRPNPANQSLGGFFSLLFIENIYTDYFTHNPALWKALTWTFSLALIAAVAAICPRQPGGEQRLELEISLVIATMPLIANIAWVDMFVLLVFPYAVLLKYSLMSRSRHPSLTPRLSMALLACVCSSVLLVSSSRFLDLFASFAGWQSWLMRNPLFLSLPIYGAAILWLTLALVLIHVRKASVPTHSLVEAR